jgi:signal peptidase I
MKKQMDFQMPASAQLEQEIKRERYKQKYNRKLRSTVYLLVTVAAAAVLVATLLMPVLQIYGSSMSPTLEEGDVVVSVKANRFAQGDIVAFYYGNKLLVKRYIAGPGQWVDMDENGNITVDNVSLYEPYVDVPSNGNADITFPYQVPEDKYFLVGDHRSVSVDSRHSVVGSISKENIVGKIVFCIWPLARFGPIA